jgi:transcriptional regulator with XRE-family HTH domain
MAYAELLSLLRKKRIDADLTQQQLADRLQVSRSFVGKTERGERRVDVIELQEICRAFNIDFIQFIIELQDRQRRR